MMLRLGFVKTCVTKLLVGSHGYFSGWIFIVSNLKWWILIMNSESNWHDKYSLNLWYHINQMLTNSETPTNEFKLSLKL